MTKKKVHSRKRITVLVKNSELDALEDILFCELKPKEYKKSFEASKKLWIKLVTAYDKDKPRFKITKSSALELRELNKFMKVQMESLKIP